MQSSEVELYFDNKARYDPAHFAWKIRHYRPNRAISMSFDWLEWHNRSVLDIGCGQGFYAIPLASRAGHITGIDISAKSIEIAQRNAESSGVSNVTFRHGDLLDYSPAEAFDVAYSITVLMHIPDVKRALQRVHSLLKGGGYFLLSEPNAWHHTRLFPWWHSSSRVFSQSFTYSIMRRLLSTNGFRILRESGRIFTVMGRRQPEQLVFLFLERWGERWPLKYLGEHIAILAQRE